MNLRAVASWVVCALALGACGGGGSTVGAPRATSSLVNGKLVLVMAQAASSTSAARAPKYISPSAISISIAVSRGATTVADISQSSPNCTTTQSGRSCTIPLVAPAGTDTFTFAQYAGANATGALLGSGTTTSVVTAGSPFTLQATLNGVVGSIQLALGTVPPAGTAGTTTLTVSAEDPSGNVIIGPGNYTTPITLAVTDSTSQTTLSSYSVTAPSSTPITVNYAGGTGTNATITATTAGSAPATVAFAPVAGCASTLSNGGFTNGLQCWTTTVVSNGVFGSSYPQFRTQSGQQCLASTTNPYFVMDTPGNAEGILSQTFTVPAGTPTLYFYTWGNLDPVTVNVEVTLPPAQPVVIGTFSPPDLMATDYTCANGVVPVIKSYDLTPYAGQTITLGFDVTSAGYDGTFAQFDDIGFTPPPPTY